MDKNRLWKGGGASRKALTAAALSAPAALVLALGLVGLAVGASLEHDRSAVLRFVMKAAAVAGYPLCLLYGLPAFLFLAGRGRAGLAPVLLVGALPGLLFGAWLAARASGVSGFTVMAAGAAAACGAFVAAVFWFVVRSLERR